MNNTKGKITPATTSQQTARTGITGFLHIEAVLVHQTKFEKIKDSRLQNIKGVTAEEFDHQIGNNNQLI